MADKDQTAPALNTDRELWRETEGDYYAPSIHVTERGNIGINVGGTVIVKPLREWHALATRTPPAPQDELVERLQEKVRNLTRLLDEQIGTPCAEIRWQQERKEQEAEIERLRADYAEAVQGQIDYHASAKAAQARAERAQDKLETLLAEFYQDDALRIAKLCDDELDPSGALLGRVRIRALKKGSDNG